MGHLGSIELATPWPRTDRLLSDWLLERQWCAEVPLTRVVATCYLLGVGTRRMERLVHTPGITLLSELAAVDA